MEFHICVSQCANHLEGWSFLECSSAGTWLLNNIADTGMVYYGESEVDVTFLPVNGTVASLWCK
jgi:hypothetical protein